VAIDGGEVRKRKKKPSKRFRERPHAAVRRRRDTLEMPPSGGWHRAYGRLPVMDDVKLEAERRTVELLLLPTTEAIKALKEGNNIVS